MIWKYVRKDHARKTTYLVAHLPLTHNWIFSIFPLLKSEFIPFITIVTAVFFGGPRKETDYEERKKKWVIPEHTKLEKGSLLERYRRMVGSSIRGAVFE